MNVIWYYISVIGTYTKEETKMYNYDVEAFLKEGQEVKPGAKLLKFDKSLIESEGFDTACVFVLTNYEDFPDAKFFTGQDVVQNETVICSFS